MNTRPSTWSKEVRIAVACGAAVLVLGVGIAGYARWSGGARRSSHRTLASAATAAPTAKQRAAAAYQYPASGGVLPRSISTGYDAVKDRSSMTLELGGLASSAPSGCRMSGLKFQVISEYPGMARRADAGELSVRCVVSLISSQPGILASSPPVAVFTADGRTIEARDPAGGAVPYHSEARPDGSHETLGFRLSTLDLLTIAASQRVSAKAGALTLSFSPSQTALVREFAARMNPRP